MKSQGARLGLAYRRNGRLDRLEMIPATTSTPPAAMPTRAAPSLAGRNRVGHARRVRPSSTRQTRRPGSRHATVARRRQAAVSSRCVNPGVRVGREPGMALPCPPERHERNTPSARLGVTDCHRHRYRRSSSNGSARRSPAASP
jgi:hypothetical protein